MTDIHQALDDLQQTIRTAESFKDRVVHEFPRIVLNRLITAARAHADWLESFPTDEDVEVLARRYAFSFTLNNRGHAQEWEHLHGWQRTQFKENARADLQAIADTRRTEEERT